MNQNEDLPNAAEEELAALKQRADMMGLRYHPSIGLDKLREKVNAAMEGKTSPNSDTDDGPDDESTQADPAAAAAQPPTTAPPETKAERRARISAEATKLIRVRITCMDPAKKEWDGEVITVANNAVGTLKKFIPYKDHDDGYHVPKMMLDHLRERMCQVFVNGKTRNGVSMRQGKMIRAFAIEELPPLTPKELKELAQRQAMATGQASS